MNKAGTKFQVELRKGEYSETLAGVEKAGRVIGPFIMTRMSHRRIETIDRMFPFEQWRVRFAP